MKRALFAFAVLALVVSVPIQHTEVQAASGVTVEFCESTIEQIGGDGPYLGYPSVCRVSRCYDLQSNTLISMEIMDCW